MKKITPICTASMMLLISVSCSRAPQITTLEAVSLPTESYSRATISVRAYCPPVGQSFTDFFVLLRSVRLRAGKALTNWARDGIADIDKKLLGLNIFSADQLNSGYGNLLLYRAGILGQSADAIRPCLDPSLASVPGWLTDCQRDFLHLDLVVDSIGRRIPDDIAVWFGLDLKDAAVATGNITGDGVPNIDKVKLNVDITETLDDLTKAQAPIYSIDKGMLDGSMCYTFSASNIPLVHASNGNLVSAYVLSADRFGQPLLKVKNFLFPPSPETKVFLEVDYDDI